MSTLEKTSSPQLTRPNLRRSRRQSPKTGTKVRAYRNALGLGPNIAVTILDVSEVGVRLVLKEPLPEKAEFAVEFEASGRRPIKIGARIVWTLLLADGNTCVGADFSKKLPYSDLAVLARG